MAKAKKVVREFLREIGKKGAQSYLKNHSKQAVRDRALKASMAAKKAREKRKSQVIHTQDIDQSRPGE